MSSLSVSLGAFVFLVLTWNTAFGVQVVFFKSFNKNGELLIYEGQYAHSAISFRGHWLHAHPYYGVQLTKSLKQFGGHYVLLENPNLPEPSEEFVKQQLSMSFNIFADWSSAAETYCSKLVGQALNIKPTKMNFKSSLWSRSTKRAHQGKHGLSPTEIYWYVRRNLRFKKAHHPIAELFTPAPVVKSCDIYLGAFS